MKTKSKDNTFRFLYFILVQMEADWKLFGKCDKCKKKCYAPEKCRCKLVFCYGHRLPENHNCSHIEKSKKEYQDRLKKQMVMVRAEKLVRI